MSPDVADKIAAKRDTLEELAASELPISDVAADLLELIE